MFLYGLKATKTGQQNLFGVKCEHCEAQGSMEMHAFSKYVHILRIPLFPVKKVTVTQCNRCRQVLSKNKFSPDLLRRFEEMKPSITTPYWQFIGIALISMFVAMGVYKTIKKNNSDVTVLNRR